MQKINILLIICALLLVFSLCGCINNNENSKIIGRWKATQYIQDSSNSTARIEITRDFYINGTMKSDVRFLNNNTSNTIGIIFYDYEFDNNFLCITDLDDLVNVTQTICYDYKFSNDNNQLTLKHENGATLIFYRE